MENGGILYVFPVFHSAWMAKKIRYPAADDLFRVSLALIGGKLAMSQILVEVITSDEVERNRDWETAKKHIEKLRLFDMPTELPMIELVFKQLRGPFIQIDIDFISKVGSLYLETISLSLEQLLAERLREN